MSERRISEVTRVLECYPELAQSGIEFRQIAAACCKRIPSCGIANNIPIVDVAEAAAEGTVVAIFGARPPRGRNVANYLVAIFKRLASGDEDIAKIDTLSRVGVRLEMDEIERVEAEAARRRAEDALRPPPDPTLPRRALAAMRPRPDIDGGWLATGPVRSKLRPREAPAPIDECQPLGAIFKRDELDEERELADARDRWHGATA